MERTLAMIKPDAVSRGLMGDIIKRIEGEGARILALKMLHLRSEQAKSFYWEHRDKHFFPGLISFMCSGPIVAICMEGENAIENWRRLMGATNPEEAAEGTIRRDLAQSVQQNCVHGSDSLQSSLRETSFFFSEADLIPHQTV